MDNIEKFYKNKNVFITGHTGFKGSWLVSVLLMFGANITGYSLNDSKRKNYNRFLNYKKVNNIYGDILDLEKLKKGDSVKGTNCLGTSTITNNNAKKVLGYNAKKDIKDYIKEFIARN